MAALRSAGSTTFESAASFIVEPAAELGFVEDALCADCHAVEQSEWERSHHSQAMAEASRATVLGDFENAVFQRPDGATEFLQRKDRYFVRAPGPDGKSAEFEVLYTFGIAPLQQYLVALPGGRLQALTIAWDAQQERWFDLQPAIAAHDDPLAWTGRHYNWNSNCAACHSTDLQKRFDLSANAFRTSASALTVGCQACHGPGREHVDWAGAGASAGEPGWGFALETALSTPRGQIGVCAACHSRRQSLTDRPAPGADFLDDYMPELLEAQLYHADGQIDDEVYVWGSFVQSAMFRAGVTCTDCHNPHSGERWMEDNGLCTACHNEAPPARFPGMQAKLYDTTDHHHHAPGSNGAACVSCHMPDKFYMSVDPRRDHSLRIPRPDLSAAIGAPNACTACHEDQTNAWAASEISEWLGGGPIEPGLHYGEALAAARTRQPDAAAMLISVLDDEDGAPAIARATAAQMLGDYIDGEVLRVIETALRSEEPLVRIGAVRAMRQAPLESRVVAAPLLVDPLRAVRVEAVQTLAAVGPASLPDEGQQAFSAAESEYFSSQMASAERPETHLNLANYHAARGDQRRAEQSLRTGLRLDADYSPALVNLADIFRDSGRDREGEGFLRRALEIDPDSALAHFSLALNLVRQSRTEDAIASLESALALEPDNVRFAYTYAVALSGAGRTDDAADVLEAAAAHHPRDIEVLSLLAMIRDRQGDTGQAVAAARRLLELQPDHPVALTILSAQDLTP